MNQAMAMRRYDDLRQGETRLSAPFPITEADILAFARQFDPQWFHCDPGLAATSPFGGLIASGAHLLALWRRMDHDLNGDIAYQCGVALEQVQFRLAVRPGDLLVVASEIVELRASSDVSRGVVTMDYVMTNQDAATVMTLRAVNLVYR